MWLTAGHWLAGPVAADEVTRGQVLVPADHVGPGATFTVSGYDLDEEAPVRIELVHGDVRVALGTASTSTDGTLDVDVVLPSSYPTGYAELHVVGAGAPSTTVLVGERAEGPAGSSDVGADEDWALLVVVLVGTVIFAFAALRVVRVQARATPANDAGGDPE